MTRPLEKALQWRALLETLRNTKCQIPWERQVDVCVIARSPGFFLPWQFVATFESHEKFRKTTFTIRYCDPRHPVCSSIRDFPEYIRVTVCTYKRACNTCVQARRSSHVGISFAFPVMSITSYLTRVYLSPRCKLHHCVGLEARITQWPFTFMYDVLGPIVKVIRTLSDGEENKYSSL